MDGTEAQVKQAPQPGMTPRDPETLAELEESVRKGTREAAGRDAGQKRRLGRSKS